MSITKNILWNLALSVLLATLQWRFTVEILTTANFIESLKAGVGVIEGRPHWVVFQARLLGPWSVYGLGELIGNLGFAYAWFIAAGFTAANFAFLWAISPLYSGVGKLAGLVLFALFTIFFIDDMWLYPWDVWSLILFAVFLGLVVRDAPLWQYGMLFVFMLFNRESVHFLSLFILARPLCDWLVESRFQPNALPGRKDRLWMLSGVGMFIIGFTTIYWLRDTLLVEEIGPRVFNAPHLANTTMHFQYEYNLMVISNGLSLARSGVELALALFFLLGFVQIALALWHLPRRFLAYTAVNGLMLMALGLVGVINETRVFFEMAPYFAFSILHLTMIFSGNGHQMAVRNDSPADRDLK